MFPGYFLKMESTRHLLTFELANGTGTFIMTSFLVIAIFRYRIWNIEHYIRKVILYSGATVIIYLSYLSVVYLVDMLTNDSDNIIHFFALAASIMIFILLRDIIQKLIDRLFHRELYNTVDVVKMFEKKFAGIYQTEALKSGIVQSLYDILHFKSFALLEKISDTAYNAIQLYGIDNFILDKEFEVNFETDELLKKTNIFSVEELREKPEIIEFCHGEIIVPLVTGDQFFGFMIIGPRLKGMSYSLQDIQVLALLANRAISLFKTASLYQKDLDRQLMLERERTRIARDVHDDVGANLTRISILCDLAKNNASDPVKITPWLHQISETSHNVILDMTQIIWALNPKNDIFEGLVAYIRRFALEYLETTPVKCTFNFPEKLPELALGGEVRRNIYLCIREALHNVVKHAEASNVLILLQVNVHGFTIMIKDDGRGFDFCKRTSGGNGMTNMMKRMKDIGGKFHIRANEKEGTEISFIVPMKSAHDN
jgi:signal transduction histidine kinase